VRIDAIYWNDDDVEHIARHGVSPSEFEDVCFGLHFSKKETGPRYILSGQTSGGRYIDVVVEKIGGFNFKPVTAFEMSDGYKARYKKRIKK
jgi:hypothetical protein